MLTLDQVKSKSAKRLEGLNPVVHQKAMQLIKIAYQQGICIVIVQGYRSIAEQDALYAQGRTKPGSIVTNARGGRSFHNYGVAIDYALLSDDGKSVLWTVINKWLKVAEIGKNLGFSWGGDWKSFKDYPHLEMTFGLSIDDYQADKRPPKTEETGDEEKLDLTDNQWKMVVNAIQGLLDKGVISDKSWIEKAEKRTLSVSELSWLNLIVMARK